MLIVSTGHHGIMKGDDNLIRLHAVRQNFFDRTYNQYSLSVTNVKKQLITDQEAAWSLWISIYAPLSLRVFQSTLPRMTILSRKETATVFCLQSTLRMRLKLTMNASESFELGNEKDVI